MKKSVDSNQVLLGFLIDKDVRDQFSASLSANGMKRGYVLEKFVRSYIANPDQTLTAITAHSEPVTSIESKRER